MADKEQLRTDFENRFPGLWIYSATYSAICASWHFTFALSNCISSTIYNCVLIKLHGYKLCLTFSCCNELSHIVMFFLICLHFHQTLISNLTRCIFHVFVIVKALINPTALWRVRLISAVLLKVFIYTVTVAMFVHKCCN